MYCIEGTNLVQLAIDAMRKDDCDEVSTQY